MSDSLIPLQTAYIRQSRDVGNNAWVVFTDKDEEIGTLSNELDPKQAMSYIHFARKFELGAFNIGIEFGKKEEHDKAEKVFQSLLAKIKELEEQNIALSDNLERFIIGEEE